MKWAAVSMTWWLNSNNRKITGKSQNRWRLNSTFLNNTWVKEKKKTQDKLKKIWTNENENTYQNLWNAMKAVLRRKFMALNVYIRKDKLQINNLNFQFRKPEKEG